MRRTRGRFVGERSQNVGRIANPSHNPGDTSGLRGNDFQSLEKAHPSLRQISLRSR